MLKQVLAEIENAGGPLHMAELSRRLGIEPGALAGMVDFWVRKGRLRDGDAVVAGCEPAGHCGPACAGTSNCAFVARMPRSFSVTVADPAPPKLDQT